MFNVKRNVSDNKTRATLVQNARRFLRHGWLETKLLLVVWISYPRLLPILCFPCLIPFMTMPSCAGLPEENNQIVVLNLVPTLMILTMCTLRWVNEVSRSHCRKFYGGTSVVAPAMPIIAYHPTQQHGPPTMTVDVEANRTNQTYPPFLIWPASIGMVAEAPASVVSM